MKTLKINEKTHRYLMSAKFIFDCKNMSEIIDKAIEEMYKNHGIIYMEIKNDDK